MRSLPHTTRVALATLFLRHRDTRRRVREAIDTHGADSHLADVARIEETTTWNAYVAANRNVFDAPADGSPRTDAHEFMRMVALRGKRHRINLAGEEN